MPQHIQYGGLQFTHSGELLADARAIIDAARHAAQQSVNVYLVARNWLLGRRIAEEELGGAERAGYGQKIVRQLAQDLTREYGKGFDFGSLYKFVRFYREFPDILDSASPQSRLLSWTHYRVLLQVDDAKARAWYEREAAQEMWSVRTLQRNVSSQYYARMLATPRKDLVKGEMQALTASHQADRLEFVKSPVIAEFLGFPESAAATLRESDWKTPSSATSRNSCWKWARDMLLLRDKSTSAPKRKTTSLTSSSTTTSSNALCCWT